METKVNFLNISDKQYKLIGITWGFLLTAFFHFYYTFDKASYSIVRTFISTDFLLKAIAGMVIGYLFSFYILRKINRI